MTVSFTNVVGVSGSGVSGSGAVYAVSGTPDSTVTWSIANSNGSMVFSNGNLRVDGGVSANYAKALSNAARKTTGKYYYEVQINNLGSIETHIGITDASAGGTTTTGSFVGDGISGVGAYASTGRIRSNGNKGTFGSAYTTGDIISILVDLDTPSFTHWKNGVENTTWNPMTTPATGGVLPALSFNGTTSAATARFARSQWTYTPPAGYEQWTV